MKRPRRRTDRLTKEARSALMARVKGKNTTPELRVRRIAFALGYRYRLHRRDLPGCPDLVFPARRSVIFVHGCFWHHHPKCPRATIPKSRTNFWRSKLVGNAKRDRKVMSALEATNWKVLVVWECETKDRYVLRERLIGFLGS